MPLSITIQQRNARVWDNAKAEEGLDDTKKKLTKLVNSLNNILHHRLNYDLSQCPRLDQAYRELFLFVALGQF